MEAKKYTSEATYWNDPEIVSFFANNTPPEYWRDFFTGVENKEKTKVLDLGCGGGRNMAILLEMGFDISACDLHVEMVNATRKKALIILEAHEATNRIIQGSMLDLPYSDSSFDIVLASGVYHNVSSREEFETAIRQTDRVLKPDGMLCLNMFTSDIVDPSLEKMNFAGLYKTPNNLDMLLISSEEAVEMLKKRQLLATFEPVRYKTEIFTGVRSVLRGVFQKVGRPLSTNIHEENL